MEASIVQQTRYPDPRPSRRRLRRRPPPLRMEEDSLLLPSWGSAIRPAFTPPAANPRLADPTATQQQTPELCGARPTVESLGPLSYSGAAASVVVSASITSDLTFCREELPPQINFSWAEILRTQLVPGLAPDKRALNWTAQARRSRRTTRRRMLTHTRSRLPSRIPALCIVAMMAVSGNRPMEVTPSPR